MKIFLTCASFYIFENTFFHENLIALRMHTCIIAGILFLPRGKALSLPLIGHHYKDGITIKISCGVDVSL